ncbi:MAG: sugar ABC transporter substrate-binding protein, partial [Thermoleophilia bacterium]
MRRKLATASWLVAVVLALVVSACGGSSSNDKTTASNSAASSNAVKKGTTVNFWIMPNGPQPQADMEKTVKPFEDQTGVKVNVEVVGWDV